MSRARRSDPDRRERILDAVLDVIAEHGVAGVTYRAVADAADVPLGSMTYHFAGMDELLREAFGRFAGTVAARFEVRMAQVDPGDRDGAARAVADIVLHDVFTEARDQVLAHELYTLAARDPGYRDLTNTWMRRCRAALERCFDPTTARLLDAMIEGMSIHRALDNEPHDDADTVEAVRRLVTAADDRPGPGQPASA